MEVKRALVQVNQRMS